MTQNGVCILINLHFIHQADVVKRQENTGLKAVTKKMKAPLQPLKPLRFWKKKSTKDTSTNDNEVTLMETEYGDFDPTKYLDMRDYDVSYKMFDDTTSCQPKVLYEYLRYNAAINNVFVDECCLRWAQNHSKSDGYYFWKCTMLEDIQNIWVALHRVSSFRYASAFKGQPNFELFEATFKEANLKMNLRNPKDIQEYSISNLDDVMKKQVASIPENLVRGVPPTIIVANPRSERQVVGSLEQAFDRYLNKEGNTEKIVVMCPSLGIIAKHVLEEAIKNVILKFRSQITFSAYFAFAEYNDIVKNLQRDIAPIEPGPSTSTLNRTDSGLAVDFDINSFLGKAQNACLFSDYLMMEGSECTTVISLFGDATDKTIVANHTRTNTSCRSMARLIVIAQ